MLSQYIGGFLTLCAFVSVALGIAHPKLRGATGFAAGVLIICAVMLPLVDIFRDFNIGNSLDNILGDVEYDRMTDSAIELAFEDGISEYIAAEYGIDRECVKVSADGFELESLRAERIYVTLRGKGVLLDNKRLEEELAERFTSGGECEVSLSIE